MIDNTQELNKVLRALASNAGIARDNLYVGRVAGQYERFMNEETQAVNEAKQAILDWHNKQIDLAYRKGFSEGQDSLLDNGQIRLYTQPEVNKQMEAEL